MARCDTPGRSANFGTYFAGHYHGQSRAHGTCQEHKLLLFMTMRIAAGLFQQIAMGFRSQRFSQKEMEWTMLPVKEKSSYKTYKQPGVDVQSALYSASVGCLVQLQDFRSCK